MLPVIVEESALVDPVFVYPLIIEGKFLSLGTSIAIVALTYMPEMQIV